MRSIACTVLQACCWVASNSHRQLPAVHSEYGQRCLLSEHHSLHKQCCRCCHFVFFVSGPERCCSPGMRAFLDLLLALLPYHWVPWTRLSCKDS